jgi:glycosyltransferase involved in cell wall biosynthesis
VNENIKYNLKIMTPKITIGLPVYNGEKFIKTCIESILNQTFLDFELLISDNASTDSTSEICNEYASKDKRIRYSCNLKNIGGIENFKYLLDIAKGKYFMWIAADDLLGDKDYLKKINNEISDKYDFYFTEVSIIDENYKFKSQKIMKVFLNCKTNFDFLKASLSLSSLFIYSLFKKEILIEDWKYIENCRNLSSFNEGLFVHAISAKRKAKFVKNTLRFFRLHNKSWSQSIKARKLIFSHTLYSFKTIHFILRLNKLTFLKKIHLSNIALYILIKNLLHFILATIWQSLSLNKLATFEKLKKRYYQIKK